MKRYNFDDIQAGDIVVLEAVSSKVKILGFVINRTDGVLGFASFDGKHYEWLNCWRDEDTYCGQKLLGVYRAKFNDCVKQLLKGNDNEAKLIFKHTPDIKIGDHVIVTATKRPSNFNSSDRMDYLLGGKYVSEVVDVIDNYIHIKAKNPDDRVWSIRYENIELTDLPLTVEVKEMTVAEIAAELGYEIKVVK